MTMGAYSWPYDNPATLSPHTEFSSDQSYYHHPSYHPYNSPPPPPVPMSRWPPSIAPPPANVHVPQDPNGVEQPPSSGGDNNGNESSSSPTRGYPPASLHPPHPHHHHVVGPYPPQPSHPHQAHHSHYQQPHHHPHHQPPNHNMGGQHHHGWGQYGNGQPPHYHQPHPHHHNQHHQHHYRPYPTVEGRTGHPADAHMHPARGSESGPGGSSSSEVALLLPEDRPLLTDYFYLLIQQLRVCRFAEGDRKSRGGKRGNITVGYGGLECTHCAVTGIGGEHHNGAGGGGCCVAAGTPRKFFWTNVDRFSNSFAGIAEHVLKCINCPDEIRSTLEDLKTRHREQMAKLPKGSQKEFFRRMWGRLHPNSEIGDGIGEGGGAANQQRHQPRSLSPPSVAVASLEGGGGGGTGMQSRRQHEPPPHRRRLPLRSSGERHRAPTNYFAPSHEAGGHPGGHRHHHHHRHHDRSHPPSSAPCPPGALVLPEDRPLLTDYFYFLNQQLKFCRFAEKDRKSRGGKRGNIVIGYGGLECRHCAAAASDDAGGESSTTPSSTPRKFFWTNVDRFSNSFAGIADHVMKCINCPDHVKAALDDLKLYHRQQMAKLPKGSQKIFFQRLWSRLHPDGGDDDSRGGATSGHHQEQPQHEQQREDHPSEDTDTGGDFHDPVSTKHEGRGKGQEQSAPSERSVHGMGQSGTGEEEAGGDEASGGRSKGCMEEEELGGQDTLPELPLVSFSFEASSEGRNKRKAEAAGATENVQDANTKALKKRAVDPKE